MTEPNALRLVDVGNTQIKYRDDNAAVTAVDTTADNLLNVLQHPSVWLCSSTVDPELDGIIAASTAHRVRSEARFGAVQNAYANPAQLGVDRWLAMIGAYKGRAVAVLDLGTAATLDVINNDGVHVGGWIIPGRQAHFDNLARISTALDASTLAASEPLSTLHCLEAGWVDTLVGGVNQTLSRCGAAGAQLLLTGGDAALLLQQSGCESFQYRPDLVFDGLGRYAGLSNAI